MYNAGNGAGFTTKVANPAARHKDLISHALPGYGVAIFDHEAIHVGCSFRSSLLNGVERQKDNDPQDREHGHDHPAPPSTFS
jgi:hypothetical protein